MEKEKKRKKKKRKEGRKSQQELALTKFSKLLTPGKVLNFTRKEMKS